MKTGALAVSASPARAGTPIGTGTRISLPAGSKEVGGSVGAISPSNLRTFSSFKQFSPHVVGREAVSRDSRVSRSINPFKLPKYEVLTRPDVGGSRDIVARPEV